MLSPRPSDSEVHLLLFIARRAKSVAAVENLQRALRDLDRTFTLEIVDVAEHPDRALEVRVMVTPTLLAPGYAGRLVGDMSDLILVRYFLETLTSD
jgi:hypothetical protein